MYASNVNTLVDDAFISFRYAENFTNGHGLVFNPGERVEGYTNFLWVLLFSAGFKMGFSAEVFASMITPLIHVLSLVAVYLFALQVLKDRAVALLVLLLTGLNHSVAGFSGSGLETPLQVLEFSLCGYLFVIAVENGWTPIKSLLISILLAISLLTRPDAILLVFAIGIGWFKFNRNKKWLDWLAFVAPFAAIILPWLIWKLSFYGTIIPNTFNVRVRGLTGVGFGLIYILNFLVYYALIPFAAIILLKAKDILNKNSILGAILLFCGLWVLYVIFSGADFMEFRFMAAILPALLIISLAMMREYIKNRAIFIALILTMISGTLVNASSVRQLFFSYMHIEPIEQLHDHLFSPQRNWAGIGKTLNDYFGDTDAIIAVGAAGAIPYYSKLETVDLLGMTDKKIPKIGEP
ncbi:hypothetical protein K8I28_07000, partial [bacterium]|nr:hypothetical protein [bacterium]